MKNRYSELIPNLYMKLIPIQIALVIISGLNSIIDNAFAGRFISQDAMAITGLFGPVSNFLNAVNALFFGGAQLLCGRYLGKHMAERTRSIFSLDIVMVFVVSAFLLITGEAAPGIYSAVLGARGEQMAQLSSYIRGFSLGLPFLCLGTQFTAFLQLEHQEKRSYAAIALIITFPTGETI